MKRLTAAVLCLLMALCLCACGADSGGLRTVTLNEVTRSVFYAPLYAACSMSFFEEEGLQVDIVTGGGSDANNMNQNGISAVVLGTGMASVHTVNEYITIENLENTAKLCLQLMQI